MGASATASVGSADRGWARGSGVVGLRAAGSLGTRPATARLPRTGWSATASHCSTPVNREVKGGATLFFGPEIRSARGTRRTTFPSADARQRTCWMPSNLKGYE